MPFNINVLRLLRVSRVLATFHYAVPSSAMTLILLFVNIIKHSVPALISIGLIHALCVYVFAIVGLHVFGYIVPFPGGFYDTSFNNFQTFVNALVMTFRLSTL
uniref:Voltage-dependent calcium channel type D subunit alpha-1 n=1 Tax=Lygus hesperus TaxID=30085 RepID=A0A0A9YG52_LYGHE